MGVFSKLKDVLFDVEEEEIPVITRDERKVVREEENPIKEVKMPNEDFEEEIEPLKEEIESISPTKKEFNFPMDDFEEEIPTRSKRDFFDEDFTSRTSFRENRKEESSKRKEEYEYDYSRLDIKNVKKDNSKGFTPSPVISPVYGILDQNYTKDDVIVKNDGSKRKSDKKLDLDDVRKKAYGKQEVVEEEPLKTLDEILIDNEEEEVIPKPKTKVKKEIEEEPILDEKAPISVYDDELPDEPYADEKLDDNKESKDLLESDLFNLIDSMYEEKNEREEE